MKYSLIVVIIFMAFMSCAHQNQAQRERTPDSPYDPNFLGEIQSEGLFQANLENFLFPLEIITYRVQHHLIAFFDEHPSFESAEVFIMAVEPLSFRAILTRHDNTQVDYLSQDLFEGFGAEKTNRKVFLSQGDFRISGDAKDVQFSFLGPEELEISIVYLGQSRPDAEYGGMTDVGEHSPGGGLPLFFREESSVSGPGSYVRFGEKKFWVPMDQAISHPPFFVGYAAFFSNGYHAMILPTFPQRALNLFRNSLFPATPTPGELLVLDGKIRRVRFLETEEFPWEHKIDFEPPLENPMTQDVGLELEYRFGIRFTDTEDLECYGTLSIQRKTEDEILCVLSPTYPAWTIGKREIQYSMTAQEGNWFTSAWSETNP